MRANSELAHSHINTILREASYQFSKALQDSQLSYEHPLLVNARESLKEVNKIRLPNIPKTEIQFYGSAVSILAGLIEDEGIDLDDADYVKYPDPKTVLFAQLYHLTKRVSFTVLSLPQIGTDFAVPETVMGTMTNYNFIQDKRK